MSKKPSLQRLARLYEMVEDRQAMQVRAASAAVFEVERAVAGLERMRAEDAQQSRDGLAHGSRIEAIAAERSAVNVAAQRAFLAKLRDDRGRMQALAVEAHRVSRIESQQIEGLARKTDVKHQTEAKRLEQHAADDRFLSRLVWTRATKPRS